MVLGSCTGKSTSYLVDTDKKTVVYFDTIVKSEGNEHGSPLENDEISATIFYKGGTIASTSQGKIIQIVNKLEAVKFPKLVSSINKITTVHPKEVGQLPTKGN